MYAHRDSEAAFEDLTGLEIGSVDFDNAEPLSDTGSDLTIDLRGPDPVIELAPRLRPTGLLAASPAQLAAKRAIDVVGAAVALVLLSPVFLLTAAAIKATSRGPVFYVSERVGKNGKTFRFLKFRTMRVEADRAKAELIDLNEADGPVFKIKEDPRITRLGRLLRRSSIDELPQLLHVLSGRMSLVGPRPPIPEEVEQYNEYQKRRLSVKPGLTCWWQVSGRSTLDFDTWVKLDIEYIETWNLRTDLAILLRTVPAVLSGRGAF